MARKAKKDTPEYWQDRLRREGLSMERGRNARLTYVGLGSTLESIEGERRMDTGQLKPKVYDK